MVGDGISLKAEGVGTVVIKISLPNNRNKRFTFQDVLYVPKMAYNLATKNGKMFQFSEIFCKILAVSMN